MDDSDAGHLVGREEEEDGEEEAAADDEVGQVFEGKEQDDEPASAASAAGRLDVDSIDDPDEYEYEEEVSL